MKEEATKKKLQDQNQLLRDQIKELEKTKEKLKEEAAKVLEGGSAKGLIECVFFASHCPTMILHELKQEIVVSFTIEHYTNMTPFHILHLIKKVPILRFCF